MRVDDGGALECGRLGVLQGVVNDGSELRVLLECSVLSYLDGVGALGEELRDDVNVVGTNSMVKGGETCLVASIDVERRFLEEGADKLDVAVLRGLEKSSRHDGVKDAMLMAETAGRAHQSLASTALILLGSTVTERGHGFDDFVGYPKT